MDKQDVLIDTQLKNNAIFRIAFARTDRAVGMSRSEHARIAAPGHD